MIEPTASFVAECFWSGVTEEDLRALDQRADATTAALADAGEAIRYLGSMLLHQDEVVLCLFEGSLSAVRHAAEQAGIPFERILESHSMWRAAAPARARPEPAAPDLHPNHVVHGRPAEDPLRATAHGKEER